MQKVSLGLFSGLEATSSTDAKPQEGEPAHLLSPFLCMSGITYGDSYTVKNTQEGSDRNISCRFCTPVMNRSSESKDGEPAIGPVEGDKH
jgi:hypothetical protein